MFKFFFTNFIIILSISIISISCTEKRFKKGRTFVGNKFVPTDKLNLGYSTYKEYCIACHGIEGDGKGVASKGLVPPPRNLTLGIYKFGRVASGDIPHDEDFATILRKGLHGTAMLPWDISDKRLDAVIQYIKTLAPKVWENKENTLGEKIILTKDPYGLAHQSDAIKKGKSIYHIEGNCQSCHRSYATKREINTMSLRSTGERVDDFDADLFKVKLQESEFGNKTLPPDFTYHPIRTATTVQELYIRIAAGVGGTAMPSWQGVLEDSEIWAVSYYIKSLMDLKNSKKREYLMAKIK